MRPSLARPNATLSSEPRLRSRHERWTTTSPPISRIVRPRVSGPRRTWPPALSVIVTAVTRGSAARLRARSRCRPASSCWSGPAHGTSSTRVARPSASRRASARAVIESTFTRLMPPFAQSRRASLRGSQSFPADRDATTGGRSNSAASGALRCGEAGECVLAGRGRDADVAALWTISARRAGSSVGRARRPSAARPVASRRGS